MQKYRLRFLCIGEFSFQMNHADFESFIRGLLWGILRDFESPDSSDAFFVRGEMLAWKLTLFMSKWGIPRHRIKEFEAWKGDEPYSIRYSGLNNGMYRK